MSRLFVVVFLIWSAGIFAQNVADSLKSVLKTNITDTTRMYTLHELGMALYAEFPNEAATYWRQNIDFADKLLRNKKGEERNEILKMQSYSLGGLAYILSNQGKNDTAIKLMEKSLENFLALNDLKGAGQVLNNLSGTLLALGRYDEAIGMQEKALKFSYQVRDYKTIGFLYQNMALIRSHEGNVPLALELFKKSLYIRDSIKDYDGLGHSFYEMGVLYSSLDQYDDALTYFQKSLDVRRNSGDKDWLAASYTEVGINLISQQNEFAKGRACLDSAIAIVEKTGNTSRAGFAYAGITEYFIRKKQYDSALVYAKKALEVRKAADEIKSIALSNYQIAAIHLYKKEYREAIRFGLRGYAIGDSMRFAEPITLNANILRRAYAESGDFENAYKFLDIYKTWEDSVNNKENQRKSLMDGMTYEFDKKKEVMKAEQEKEKAKLEAERDKQKTRMLFAVGILVLVGVFSFVIFRKFRESQRQKKIIELKNKETERQKEIIEEKQTEILDSIHYAKRIQQALITNEKYIERNLRRLNKC